MSPETTLETARLVLRPMVASDLDALTEIFGDPVVMAAFGEGPLDRARVEQWLARNLSHQAEHGFGLFAVWLKGGGLIGDCGLEMMELGGESVAELGYDFRSDCWNRGYATEAACGVRDYAVNSLGLRSIVSLIRPDNAASARVAEKVGARRAGTIEKDGRSYVRYDYAAN